MAGPAPRRYLVLHVGKFSAADFFDQNSYSHDPRIQFLNWSLMSAGAWDYPANTRGYTVGGVLAYVSPGFTARFASTLMPTLANGSALDFHYGTAHAETVELTKGTAWGAGRAPYGRWASATWRPWLLTTRPSGWPSSRVRRST